MADEQALSNAVLAALKVLLAALDPYVKQHGYEPQMPMHTLKPVWARALQGEVETLIEDDVVEGYLAEVRDQDPGGDPQSYARQYLTSVHNRMVGVSDTVFDIIRDQLIEGGQAGEGIDQLAKRIDETLADEDRWAGRARMVARTEMLGALSAGHQEGAGWLADALGVDRATVVKDWLFTHDERTRHSHRGVAPVVGLGEPFTVGGAPMQRPGDFTAPPEQVIQCRCSVNYLMPGDPGYDRAQARALTAGGSMARPDRWVKRAAQAVLAKATADLGLLYDGTLDLDAYARLVGLFDVSRMPPKLQAYWLGPEGAAKIGYGTPGQFKRCQAALRGKVPGRMIDGTCANLIHTATGEWPGKQGDHATSTLRFATSDEGTVDWQDPPPHGIPDDVDPTPVLDPDSSDNVNGAVIVALPAADDPVHGIGPEEKHATLIYMGHADKVDATMAEVASAVQAAAAGQAHMDLAVTSLEPLGDDGALVWMLAPGSLGELHEQLKGDPVIGPLYDAVDQFPSYTAHSTVGYPTSTTDDVDDAAWPAIEDAAGDVTSIRYDRLALWWGEDRTEFPLASTEAPPEEAPVTSAADEKPTPPPPAKTPPEGPDAANGSTAPCLKCGTELTRKDDEWQAPDGSIGCDEGGSHQPDLEKIKPPAEQDDAKLSAASDNTAGQPGEQQDNDQAGAPQRWSGVLCPEGIKTGDGRKFRDGAIQWFVKPGTPITLKAMFADQPGHDGSVPVGLIETVERREDGKLYATGSWDTSADAVEARRQNIKGIMRGVSVDLDDTVLSFETADGTPLEGEDIFDLELTEEPVMVVDSARLRSATMWCMPAYVDAYVLDDTIADQVPDTSLVEAEGSVNPVSMAASGALTAAATATTRVAPAAAFADPGLTEPTPLTVTDDGRVFGHLATWGTCHIGFDGVCITPPESPSSYAHFATGVYVTADGESIPVGTLTMGTGHADLTLGARPSVDHYDDTGTAAAYIAMGQDEIGIWFAGALDEDLPPKMVAALKRAGSVSGDWRTIGGQLDLVAALAVNVPGFPIPRTKTALAASGGHQSALVAAGVLEHNPEREAGIDYAQLAREVSAYQARQARHDAAMRRVTAARRDKALAQFRDRRRKAALTRLNMEV